MKHIVLTTLPLLILGITIVGCTPTVDPEIDRALDTDAPTAAYTGPQTVRALMAVFDTRYSDRVVHTHWTAAAENSPDEKRYLAFTIVDMDAKYPREKWIQTLLNNGVTIEDFKTYAECLDIRSNLILKEFYSPDDWETAKMAYIDTQIQEYRDLLIKPPVEDWIVLGENRFPVIPGRMYVKKTELGTHIWHAARSTVSAKSLDGKQKNVEVTGPELSEEQKFALLNNGVEPVGWEVVYLDENGNYILQD